MGLLLSAPQQHTTAAMGLRRSYLLVSAIATAARIQPRSHYMMAARSGHGPGITALRHFGVWERREPRLRRVEECSHLSCRCGDFANRFDRELGRDECLALALHGSIKRGTAG